MQLGITSIDIKTYKNANYHKYNKGITFNFIFNEYTDFCQYPQIFGMKTCGWVCYLPIMKQATADFYLGFYVLS